MKRPFRFTPFVVLRIAMLVAVGWALVWHLLPHVVWALHFDPELSSMDQAAKLDARFVTEFDAPPADWIAIEHRGLILRVPLASDIAGDCARAKDSWRCHTDGGGKLMIHDAAPPDTFWQMVNMRAPDRGDLSIWRSASANWETIQALRVRVTTSRARLHAWRYTGQHTHGVVAHTDRNGVNRSVVVAYATDGRDSRTVGLVGLPIAAVERVVGSIEFPAPVAAAAEF